MKNPKRPTHARQTTRKRRLRPCSHTDQGHPSKPEEPPIVPEASALKAFAEILAGLETARDKHASDLNAQIFRLKQLLEFAAKAAEITSQKIAPQQKGPLTVGGFLVI